MAGRPYLAAPGATLEILKKYDLHTQKKFGQNFLIDAHIPEKITEAAQVEKTDCIIEIGPGIGTLTQFLAQRAGRVIAVEIDEHLIPALEETLSEYDNATVLQADILKVDLQELIAVQTKSLRVKVVANLPYYITTPILMTMLEAKLPVVSYTVMVQKEVADRMQAGPGSKDYGALSLAVQYYTSPQVVMQVPPTCFLPQPKVGSTVIQLVSKCTSPADALPEEMEAMLFRIIRAAFGQRRKTLYNALKNSSELPYGGEEIREALEACGFRPDIRGEALSLEKFIHLVETLERKEYTTGKT